MAQCPFIGGWVGGGARGQTNVCIPKIDLPFRVPLIKFIFFPEEQFSDVAGVGGLGQAEEPRLPPMGVAEPWPGLDVRGEVVSRCLQPPLHPPDGRCRWAQTECVSVPSLPPTPPFCSGHRIVEYPIQEGDTALYCDHNHTLELGAGSTDS